MTAYLGKNCYLLIFLFIIVILCFNMYFSRNGREVTCAEYTFNSFIIVVFSTISSVMSCI